MLKTALAYFYGSLLLLFSQTVLATTPLPQHDGNVHVGVANCTTSSCHGRAAAKPDGQLPQNEYKALSFYTKMVWVVRPVTVARKTGCRRILSREHHIVTIWLGVCIQPMKPRREQPYVFLVI